MMLNDYIDYIKNPLAEKKPKVVIVPPGETLSSLHRFLKERGNREIRLSDLVSEDAWLPMPSEVFERICVAMDVNSMADEPSMLLGLSGYLGLLTDENKRTAIFALREWIDGSVGRNTVCILLSDDSIKLIIKDVFSNPRYKLGKQLIEIIDAQVEPQVTVLTPKVILVGEKLVDYIPEECDTFQKYLRHVEDYPKSDSIRRIVVASEKQLPGLNVEVRQLVTLVDFIYEIYAVDGAGLSENALRWMCELAKKNVAGKTMSEILKRSYFSERESTESILSVFDGHREVERESIFWMLK